MRYLAVAAIGVLFLVGGCGTQTSDTEQQDQQEKLLAERTRIVGMPAIKNFREAKLVKMIFEMRDQNINTYTYMENGVQGLVYLGPSIGYGIPYATQFTNPQKADWYGSHGYIVLPQADPNTLFTPASAEGTWILLKDPYSPEVKVVYIESKITVSPFLLKFTAIKVGSQ